MDYVPFLDQSGLVTLESVVKDWSDRGIQVYISGANAQVYGILKKVGIIPSVISEENCYDTLENCVKEIQYKVRGKDAIYQYEHALLERHVLENRLKMAMN
jgi:SulP family sulfate permease